VGTGLFILAATVAVDDEMIMMTMMMCFLKRSLTPSSSKNELVVP
jgi:hypothetical protein